MALCVLVQGTPYVMRRRILRGPSGSPCSPPPWGTLVAVDLKSQKILWESPLGSMSRTLDAESASSLEQAGWGSPNLGGPITTAGGVVFIAAAMDRWLHAFDVETGEELWRGPLPNSGKATPMTYQNAIRCCGRRRRGAWGEGDYLVAFHLPSPR